MSKTFRFVVSEAVDCLLQLDNPDCVQGYGIVLAGRQPVRGTAIEGTLPELEAFAQKFLCGATGNQDDAPIQTRRAAERAGEKLLAFVKELRAKGIS